MEGASTLRCIKSVKSSPLCSSSLLSLCPQLAARLGRRPAPGNLCSSTYADLAAAGHHVCPRMWALGRCCEGGRDGGMLREKKVRSRKLKQKGIGCFLAERRHLKVMTALGPKVAHKLLTSTQALDWELKLSVAL